MLAGRGQTRQGPTEWGDNARYAGWPSRSPLRRLLSHVSCLTSLDPRFLFHSQCLLSHEGVGSAADLIDNKITN